MAKKGHRERIEDPFDYEAFRRDTSGLSAASRGIWLDWIEELKHPVAAGRISAPIEEWARLGRCTVEEARKAVAELKKWGVADVKTRNRGQTHGQHVDISCRRVERKYKRKEEKRLCEERRRKLLGCGQDMDADEVISRKNGFPTVRKKDPKKDPSDPKDRGISRKKAADGKPSVSVSGNMSSTEPIPNPIRKEDIWEFRDIVRLAAAICGEVKSAKTRNTFQIRYRWIGDHAFRSEVASFFAELEANEEPARRGAALTSRLTALMESAKIRKAAEESLATAATAKAPACRHCGDTGTIRDVPVPEGDFTEGGKRDLPCGFCLAGTREMERAGMPPAQQQELVRHEMEALKVAPEEFAGRN